MDVHLRSTTVCALDAETGEAVTRRFRGNPWGEVAEWMSGFPGPSLAAYESGYLGFAPQRELSGLGVDCVVAAVSRVPRSAADLSSKNDRNDAAPFSLCARRPPHARSQTRGTPPKERIAGRRSGIRGYETEPKASTTCRGRTGTGSTAGPADRLQAVGGAIVALDSGLGHMSERVAFVTR